MQLGQEHSMFPVSIMTVETTAEIAVFVLGESQTP